MSHEPHVDRKALKKPDGFVQLGLRALGALFQERNYVMGALVCVALAAAAYYGYSAWNRRVLARDWLAYYQAETAKESEQVAKYKQAYENGGKTRAAFLAAVALGDHYFQSAQSKVQAATGKDLEPSLSLDQAAQNSVDWYRKAGEFSFLLQAEKDLLTLNLGQAFELQGKADEAQSVYQKVADGNGPSRAMALLSVGRIWEAKKNSEKAKATYQAVATDFANTEYAKIAKNYLRRMDSPLLANP